MNKKTPKLEVLKNFKNISKMRITDLEQLKSIVTNKNMKETNI